MESNSNQATNSIWGRKCGSGVYARLTSNLDELRNPNPVDPPIDMFRRAKTRALQSVGNLQKPDNIHKTLTNYSTTVIVSVLPADFGPKADSGPEIVELCAQQTRHLLYEWWQSLYKQLDPSDIDVESLRAISTKIELDTGLSFSSAIEVHSEIELLIKFLDNDGGDPSREHEIANETATKILRHCVTEFLPDSTSLVLFPDMYRGARSAVRFVHRLLRQLSILRNMPVTKIKSLSRGYIEKIHTNLEQQIPLIDRQRGGYVEAVRLEKLKLFDYVDGEYKRLKKYLDNDWISGLTKDGDGACSRLWELQVASFLDLRGVGFSLVNYRAGRKSMKGPDFLIQLDSGLKVWIEATTPKIGRDLQKFIRGKTNKGMFNPPIHEVALRVTTAIEPKIKKINEYRNEGIISSGDLALIALGMGSIDFGTVGDFTRIFYDGVLGRSIKKASGELVRLDHLIPGRNGVDGFLVGDFDFFNRLLHDAFSKGTNDYYAFVLYQNESGKPLSSNLIEAVGIDHFFDPTPGKINYINRKDLDDESISTLRNLVSGAYRAESLAFRVFASAGAVCFNQNPKRGFRCKIGADKSEFVGGSDSQDSIYHKVISDEVIKSESREIVGQLVDKKVVVSSVGDWLQKIYSSSEKAWFCFRVLGHSLDSREGFLPDFVGVDCDPGLYAVSAEYLGCLGVAGSEEMPISVDVVLSAESGLNSDLEVPESQADTTPNAKGQRSTLAPRVDITFEYGMDFRPNPERLVYYLPASKAPNLTPEVLKGVELLGRR